MHLLLVAARLFIARKFLVNNLIFSVYSCPVIEHFAKAENKAIPKYVVETKEPFSIEYICASG